MKGECVRVILKQGDCISLLKSIENNSVDFLLTDPPYNISKDNNFTTMGRSGIDFGEWDKNFDLFSWMNELPRILSKDGGGIIFNDWKNIGEMAKYCESLGLVIKDMITWKKTNPMPRNRDRRYITDYECGFWFTMPKAKWTFNRSDEAYQRPMFSCSLVKNSERIHPTQKPVKLMEDLLLIHTNENDTVLDCFMGSGSVGVACKNLNRKFIGFELENEYFETAKERLVG